MGGKDSNNKYAQANQNPNQIKSFRPIHLNKAFTKGYNGAKGAVQMSGNAMRNFNKKYQEANLKHNEMIRQQNQDKDFRQKQLD